MKEIERVLKSGGVVSIATEIFVGTELEKLHRYREKDSRFPYQFPLGITKYFRRSSLAMNLNDIC